MASPANDSYSALSGAELDGVRVYQEGNNVIVTKEDLYP